MTPPAAVFDDVADDYDSDPHHAVIAERLVATLRPHRPRLVVDVATGTGFAALAALRALAPERILAVDLSPRMIAQAVAKSATADPDGRIDWRVAPAVPLDLVSDGTVDVVLCASALH
ncbi:MAG: class I SAM-dependent methyltransferase, partial [Actinomycetes bacterium]